MDTASTRSCRPLTPKFLRWHDTTRAYCCVIMKTALRYPLPAQVPGWKVAEPTTRRRWLPPLESWDKRPLV